MTPHDTPLPAWVSVDQLGSWDDLVQEVEQLWPDVVAEASQANIIRRGAQLPGFSLPDGTDHPVSSHDLLEHTHPISRLQASGAPGSTDN